MKARKGQIAIVGPATHQFGRVTKVTAEGFYARFRNAYPKVPGGREYGSRSQFFANDQIGPDGYKCQGVTLRDDPAPVQIH